MTQTIGIIGSGMIGSQVARLSTAAGFHVILSNSRGPDSLTGLVKELGSLASAATLDEAVQRAELVVASIPFSAYTQLPAAVLAGKVVIDTMNYYPERDGAMADVATDKISTSELVQRHLANSHVVRALNNMDWVRLRSRARAAGAADRSALPIAGNDASAKAVVATFLARIGYDAVDIGTLSESWRSEPTTPAYVAPYLGKVPAGLSGDASRAWFMEAPGAHVSVADITSLVAQAVRHDKMFGDVHRLPGATF